MAAHSSSAFLSLKMTNKEQASIFWKLGPSSGLAVFLAANITRNTCVIGACYWFSVTKGKECRARESSCYGSEEDCCVMTLLTAAKEIKVSQDLGYFCYNIVGRHGSLIVSALVSGLWGLDSSPSQGHSVVFLGSASLYPGV